MGVVSQGDGNEGVVGNGLDVLVGRQTEHKRFVLGGTAGEHIDIRRGHDDIGHDAVDSASVHEVAVQVVALAEGDEGLSVEVGQGEVRALRERVVEGHVHMSARFLPPMWALWPMRSQKETPALQ